jgi:hypothetical protein
LETVTEPARVLLVAALLASTGFSVYVWRLVRIDPAEPERLIGELRFAHWMALTLAAVGGAWIGLAAGRQSQMLSGLDLTVAIGLIVTAAWTLTQDVRGALTILCVAFLAHAIIDAAHRPDWMAADIAPLWFTLGCAGFNLVLSALCYRVQRR